MRRPTKSLLRCILFLALILNSCTTIEVKKFEKVRLEETFFPKKLEFQAGDNEILQVSKYELKNAVFFYEFLKKYMETQNKLVVLVNKNIELLEVSYEELATSTRRIEKERDVAYIIGSVIGTGTIIGIGLSK